VGLRAERRADCSVDHRYYQYLRRIYLISEDFAQVSARQFGVKPGPARFIIGAATLPST
jgi:hypothetical protein